VQKLMSCARNFSWDELQEIMEGLMEMDLKLKNTQQDAEILLEALLVQICRKK